MGRSHVADPEMQVRKKSSDNFRCRHFVSRAAADDVDEAGVSPEQRRPVAQGPDGRSADG